MQHAVRWSFGQQTSLVRPDDHRAAMHCRAQPVQPGDPTRLGEYRSLAGELKSGGQVVGKRIGPRATGLLAFSTPLRESSGRPTQPDQPLHQVGCLPTGLVRGGEPLSGEDCGHRFPTLLIRCHFSPGISPVSTVPSGIV